MSQRYSSVDGILTMLDRGGYTREDINQALADLNAMKDNISDRTYRDVKALLEAKLK